MNFNSGHFRYPQQFRYTVSSQFWKNNKNIGHESMPFFSNIAPFLSEKNYLGKLLSPHIYVVMEIMYHNMLKAGPVRHQFTETFPEYYEFMKSSPKPKYGFNTLYQINISDYLGQNNKLSYRPHVIYSPSPLCYDSQFCQSW